MSKVTMKHTLYIVSIVLPLVCNADLVMAQPVAPPPLYGPYSVFGEKNAEAAPTMPAQGSHLDKTHSRWHHTRVRSAKHQ